MSPPPLPAPWPCTELRPLNKGSRDRFRHILGGDEAQHGHGREPTDAHDHAHRVGDAIGSGKRDELRREPRSIIPGPRQVVGCRGVVRSAAVIGHKTRERNDDTRTAAAAAAAAAAVAAAAGSACPVDEEIALLVVVVGSW